MDATRFAWALLFLPLIVGCPTRTVYYDGGPSTGGAGGAGTGGAGKGGVAGSGGTRAGGGGGGAGGTAGMPASGGSSGEGGSAGQPGSGGGSAAGNGTGGQAGAAGGGGACGAPTDQLNCGACGHNCTTLANVKSGGPAVECRAGVCYVPASACASGFGHCSTNPDDGCETDLTSASNCGHCGMKCTAPMGLCSTMSGTPTCASSCSPPAASLCGNKCVNTQSDALNCGACNHDCSALPHVKAGAPVQCMVGVCQVPASSCASGYGHCTSAAGDVGCETALNACGGCGTVSGTPGGSCNSCGKYMCSTDKASLTCVGTPGPVGCSNNAPQSCDATGHLTTGTACSGNLVCSANACKTSCTQDLDCQSGYFCQASKCHLGATAIAAGDLHTCALRSDGKVFCWGAQYDLIPVPVQLSKTATAIASARGNSCALLTDRTVACWGDNDRGQLGNGSFQNSPVPVAVQGLPTPAAATAIAVGYTAACAISGGAVYCWGDNSSGQLGDNMTSDSGIPTAVQVNGLRSATQVGVGNGAACAVDSGKAYCWGSNTDGAIGNGSTDMNASFLTPQAVALAGGGAISAIAAGYSAACLMSSAGSVYCWGNNQYGTLGRGVYYDALPYSATPGQIAGSVAATAISTGTESGQACALSGHGAVECWGDNVWGELGNGLSTGDHSADSFVPVSVQGLPLPAVAISAGTDHTCAILNNGSPWCWGDNASGNLGDGTTTQRSVPVQVVGW